MSVWTKIVQGSATRRSRLHDELGNRIPFGRLVRHGPSAVVTAIGRLAFNHRSVRPWISYDAQKLIASRLTKDSRVLEFGSGMSTVWYAAHAKEVVSIEDYRPWYDKVDDIIKAQKVDNVRYRYADTLDDYTAATVDEGAAGFDLIMVDGSARDTCVEHALPLLRPGGMIYLDNADMGKGGTVHDMPRARALIEAFAKEHGGTVQTFTDLAPTQLFVVTGMMMTLPR